MKKHVNIIAVLLILCLIAVASSCRYSSNVLVVTDPSAGSQQSFTYNYQTQSNVATSNNPYSTTGALQPDITAGTQTTAAPSSTFVPTTNAQTPSVTQPSGSTPAVTEADISTWNTQQIVQYLTDAVNKTKAYTGNVTANRSEELGITIEEISPNLPMLKNIANSLVGKFIKPVNEVVQFSGGVGTSEDEQIPLLLPKRQTFTLPASGVQQASASKSGNNIVIDLTLVQESSSMTNPPLYNSQAVGYLDVNSVDLGAITIDTLDFVYLGTTIHSVIGPTGYILSADYHIPLKVSASGKAVGISGSFSGTGYQTEKWVINW
ncbi:MAG: hypothetical protein IJR51_10865 [Clostridia bacterium]|nr:hypothetical protein [Clostridia bacterium]